MSTEKNVQTVKGFFAAMGSYDEQQLLALVAEDVAWIIPGNDWPLAGTHRGHDELAAVLRRASQQVEMTHPRPPEFVTQGDRVLINPHRKAALEDWRLVASKKIELPK